MRVLFSSLILSTVVVVSACGSEASSGTLGSRAALDEDYLTRELALALASIQANENPQFSDSPLVEAPQAAQPVAAPRPQAAARPRPAPAASVPVRQPRVVTQTNSRRDAAIGAGLGAAVGAVAHKPNRWKGAVIGAAVGGAAGAVVGATIDKKTTVVYD